MAAPVRRPEDFLSAFQYAGCFLEDLAIEPVNDLRPQERREACRAGIGSLARRIRPLNPRVIAVISYGIERWVADALEKAGHGSVERERLPFPTSRPRRVDGIPYRQVYVNELADLVRRWRRRCILASA
jgi:hypothetical protein